jgi:DNA-binding GntR family transcriptional regulator
MSEAGETVVEHTISAIRRAIRDGRYAHGQRLVVADVTKALGVSAGPVREAIRRLTGEGLVEVTPHRGASVRAFRSKDVREIFQVREVIEGLASRLAAEHIAVADHQAALQASLAEMREIAGNPDKDYIRHNQSFHELIYRMSGNERVRETATQLTLPIYQLRVHYMIGREYRRNSAAEHELIAEAIFDGDGARAERMMRNHIRNSGIAVLDGMENSASGNETHK